MKINLKDKKAEAVNRMKYLLKIFPETIHQFDEDGLVSISEQPFGAFYWADDETKKIIADFENEYNALVYLGVRTYFKELGKMDSFFYVSDERDEWEFERQDLIDNQSIAYVYNYNYPELSEISAIGFKKTSAAGLLRTW